MQPAVISAIDEWEVAWSLTELAATEAMQVAFPPLRHAKRPTGCCDVMLDYEHGELGEGRLCIDNEGRATIEFDDVPNAVIAEAFDAVFGLLWFDGADGPLQAAGPGTYNYDDECTSAEFEVILGEHGVGRVYVCYARVPDAVAVLEALTAAAERRKAAGE